MANGDLRSAIEHTKGQIYKLKQKIEETSDPQEKRRLLHQMKELQYLQLWHMDQMR